VKHKLDALIEEMIEKGIRLPEARREFEKRFVAQVLETHKGNVSRAAQQLRMHRNTLGKKIVDFKL
jgi:Fis family transcriptional regulator, factor for inversion stimulation protein